MMFPKKRAATSTPAVPQPPKPVVIKASGTFDGNDGKWSTFYINVGGDGNGAGQNFKVLISTSSPVTMIPGLSDWCNEDCAKTRGIMSYEGAQPRGLKPSSTWNEAGIYDIPYTDWWPSGLYNDSKGALGGLWGLDYVGLGEASKDSLTLGNQYIVSYTFPDLYIGSFGLAVGSVAPGGDKNPKPNFLNVFKEADQIPSASYAYSAGASYRNSGRGIPGSLVLGGYDKTRVGPLNTTIKMANERNHTLLIGVQSVTYKPKQEVEANAFSFTKTGFWAIIDSTLPYLVLPKDICDLFAQRFQLGYDATKKLYTVNTTAHEWNQLQNATVTFKIGSNPRDSSDYVAISLPYMAFNVEASSPIYQKPTMIFPIKRSDTGVNILGRTFLQEAYIIVDYNRTKFSVAQAAYSEPMANEATVPIYNEGYVPINGFVQASNRGLSRGAIAGVVIGIVVGFLFLGVAAFFYWKKRRSARQAENETEHTSDVDTVVADNDIKYRRISELTGSEPPNSPKAAGAGGYYGDNKTIPPISEMSPESTPAELYSPPMGSGSDRENNDYFTGGARPRRRHAVRSSSGNNTLDTPIAELPGDSVRPIAEPQNDVVSLSQNPTYSRGPSDTSLGTNIDEILTSPRSEPGPNTKSETPITPLGVSGAEASTSAAAEEGANPAASEERRPSHVRGLSDTTVQSDSTAVSQPSPEELENWARNPVSGSNRPLSQ